jgi:hypothetical protein
MGDIFVIVWNGRKIKIDKIFLDFKISGKIKN